MGETMKELNKINSTKIDGDAQNAISQRIDNYRKLAEKSMKIRSAQIKKEDCHVVLPSDTKINFFR